MLDVEQRVPQSLPLGVRDGEEGDVHAAYEEHVVAVLYAHAETIRRSSVSSVEASFVIHQDVDRQDGPNAEEAEVEEQYDCSENHQTPPGATRCTVLGESAIQLDSAQHFEPQRERFQGPFERFIRMMRVTLLNRIVKHLRTFGHHCW